MSTVEIENYFYWALISLHEPAYLNCVDECERQVCLKVVNTFTHPGNMAKDSCSPPRYFMSMNRIAIIDDDDSWCFVLATRLRQFGYAVTTFTDPDIFLKEVETFDLALIDFSMPPKRYQANTDGPDIIRLIKQKIPNPPLLVLMSAYFADDLLQYTADLCPEADASLSKNIDSGKMVQQIEKLLKAKKSRLNRRNDQISRFNPLQAVESHQSFRRQG